MPTLTQSGERVRLDITGGALYYHEKRLSPRWAAAMQLTKAVGDHKFYAAKPKKAKATI